MARLTVAISCAFLFGLSVFLLSPFLCCTLYSLDYPTPIRILNLTIYESYTKMSQFPREIWLQVCGELSDFDDLKSLRLVCKHVAHTAADYLFRRAHLSLDLESLDRLHLIATYLPVYVKELYLRSDILKDVHNEIEREYRNFAIAGDYPRELRIRDLRGEVERSLTPLLALQRKRYEQLAVGSSGRIKAALAYVLSKFSNLRTLKICAGTGNHLGKETHKESAFRMMQLALGNLPASTQLSSFSTQCALDETEWRILERELDPGLMQSHFKSVATLHAGVGSPFLLGRSVLDGYLSRTIESPAPPQLTILLGYASRLVHLSLDLHKSSTELGRAWANSRWEDQYGSFAEAVGDLTWPNLKSLCLNYLSLDPKHLSQFLSRHNSTLKSLTLSSFIAADCKRGQLLQVIRPAIQLDSICFHGVRYSRLIKLDEFYTSQRVDKPWISLEEALKYLICGQKFKRTLPESWWDMITWELVQEPGPLLSHLDNY